MAKGSPTRKGAKGGAGFVPPKHGGNKPGATGGQSGGKRGNIPPKK